MQQNNKKMKNLSLKLDVKGVEDEKRIIRGLASKFDNVDAYGDRVMQGAFSKAIREWGPEGKNRIKLYSQHDTKKPIGKTLELKETADGLEFTAQFGTHKDGEDHYLMAKEEILTEVSIGYVTTKGEPNDHGGEDIYEVKLYEYSLVSIAANDEAKIMNVKSDDVKGITAEEILDDVINLVSKYDTHLSEEKRFSIESQLYKAKGLFQGAATQADSDPQVKEESLEPTEDTKSDAYDQMLDYL